MKNVQKTKFKAAEMILDPWNQQCPRIYVVYVNRVSIISPKFTIIRFLLFHRNIGIFSFFTPPGAFLVSVSLLGTDFRHLIKHLTSDSLTLKQIPV